MMFLPLLFSYCDPVCRSEAGVDNFRRFMFSFLFTTTLILRRCFPVLASSVSTLLCLLFSFYTIPIVVCVFLAFFPFNSKDNCLFGDFIIFFFNNSLLFPCFVCTYVLSPSLFPQCSYNSKNRFYTGARNQTPRTKVCAVGTCNDQAATMCYIYVFVWRPAREKPSK